MYRQILGYIPSNVIPAVVSVGMIYAYTRMLSPAAFGSYSYIFSVVLVLQASLFYALPIAVMRFFPAASRDGRQVGLLKEAYVVFYLMSIATAAICVCAGLLLDLPANDRTAAFLAIPMLLFRSLVQLNQSVNRSANLMRRFNIVECLHAITGFGLGLLAMFLVGRDAEAIVLGLLIAAVICSCIDFPLLVSPFRPAACALDRAELVRLVEYAWPLVAVAATGMILQTSDRFILGSLGSAEALGIFAVAYNLIERPTTLIANSISTATFPLVVQVLEHQGREAARIQAGRNGIALLAFTLPACAGLALTSDYIAGSLVGPAFRGGVAALLPVMCVSGLMRALRAHFVDHAFHLSGQPLMMLWTYGPAAVLNIALNLYVVPRYGMFGAAWTAVLCQTLTVVAGWFIGTSLFPVWLPAGQVVRVGVAVVPMILGLTLIRFPLNWVGLFSAMALGGGLYLVSAMLLDVGEIRSRGGGALRRWQRGRLPA